VIIGKLEWLREPNLYWTAFAFFFFIFIMAYTNICSSKTLEAVEGQELSDNIEKSRDDLAE